MSAVSAIPLIRASFAANNHAQVMSRVADLKRALAASNSLLAVAPESEQIATREALEIALLTAVRSKDVAAFDRTLPQLAVYAALPASPRAHLVSGLALMRLLAAARVADFHSLREQISDAAAASVYVRYALQVEQSLMEGTFNKVLNHFILGIRNIADLGILSI